MSDEKLGGLCSFEPVVEQQALHYPLLKCQCQEEAVLFLSLSGFSCLRSKEKKIPVLSSSSAFQSQGAQA